MKIFDKAVLKLTIIYACLLLFLELSLSYGFYQLINLELDRPRTTSRIAIFNEYHGELALVMRERDNLLRVNLLNKLIYINLCLTVATIVASYFLARRTLQPINDMMEAQSRFVSDASHELRTPITSILLENEVLLLKPDITKEDLLTQIHSNIEEMSKLQRLTNYLLQLGKDQSLELTLVPIKKVVSEVITKLTPIAKAKNITLKSELKPHSVKANFPALVSLVSILVENAIKYSPPDTTVHIKFQDHKLQVIDQGCGIAPEDLPHIFERFYRAEQSRTSEGFGLGLSLAQNLSSQMNLKITATNNQKEGATFSIVWYN
ncbi:HAMP domain-containing histidine kinase [Microgenomates group bacterium]|nr:HAMP domain-containing histidine kinase [Microgenomates group bacterium]